MKFLLGTHIAIWAIAEPGKLTSETVGWITNPDYDIHVSIVALWEIAIKRSAERRVASLPPVELAAAEFAATGFGILPISLGPMLNVESMPFHHRDPLDRRMVAQAAAEGMIFLTADQKLAAYGHHVRVM